jgi:hypothetical protein
MYGIYHTLTPFNLPPGNQTKRDMSKRTTKIEVSTPIILGVVSIVALLSGAAFIPVYLWIGYGVYKLFQAD